MLTLRPTLLCGLLCLLLVVAAKRPKSYISPATWEKLKDIKSTKEFLLKYVKKKSTARIPITQEEKKAGELESILFTGSASASERGATQVSGMIATSDACEPKLTSVEVPQTDPSLLLWPTCTKLNRCGGCCGSSVYECSPTKKVTHSLSIMKCKPSEPDSDDFNVIGVQIMNFDEHLECACQCKVKEKDCDNNKHEYLPHECRCKCRNEAEMSNCVSPKKWDHDTCGCVCREVYTCHPEEMFSHTNCRCETRSTSRYGQSGGNTGTDPCPRLSCGQGYIKQPFNGRCRCVVSSSINVQQGNLPRGGNYYPRRRTSAGRRYPYPG